jgi:RNA polymerase sigma factor (sigma-70 family)
VVSADKKEVGDVVNSTAQATEIFSLYGDFIRSIIHYQVKDANLVDDVFQDFFLYLVANPVPPDVRNVKNYLYRIVINDSKNAIQRIGNYQGRIQRYSKILKNSINNDLPEKALIVAEETEKALRMIEDLLPRCESQAITLRFKDDSGAEKVSKQRGISKRSVSRYASVGLSKLRKYIVKKEGV